MNKSKYGLSLSPSRRFLKELVLALAVIFIWYGVWTFLDLYFFPNTLILKIVLPVLFGLFLLYLLDDEIMGKYDEF